MPKRTKPDDARIARLVAVARAARKYSKLWGPWRFDATRSMYLQYARTILAWRPVIKAARALIRQDSLARREALAKALAELDNG